MPGKRPPPRTPIIEGNEALIPLTRGMFARVDIADLPVVNERRWQAVPWGNTWAASASFSTGKPKPRHQIRKYLHRVLMGEPVGTLIDHANGDGLDNRRVNIRAATHAQNTWNARKRSGTSSRYRGVTRHRQASKWQAAIKVGGKNRHLGLFENEEDAARAYDAAARELYGAFASLNGEAA